MGELGLHPSTSILLDADQFRQRLDRCERHGYPAAEVYRSSGAPLTDADALARGEFLNRLPAVLVVMVACLASILTIRALAGILILAAITRRGDEHRVSRRIG